MGPPFPEITDNGDSHAQHGHWSRSEYSINRQMSIRLENDSDITLHYCMFVKSKNRAIIFAEIDSGDTSIYDCDVRDMVHPRIYDCDTRCGDSSHWRWTKVKANLSPRFICFTWAPILKGNYVVLVGYVPDSQNFSNFIYLYSVNERIFHKSSIKCPEKGYCEAVAVNDAQKDELATFGFMRKKWKTCDMGFNSFPPEYLMRIISEYYINEYIHIFFHRSRQYYKIDIMHVMNFQE